LLTVLVIMGMAASVVALSVSRRSDRMTLSALATEIASRARATRGVAIESGRDSVLLVDVGRRNIMSGGRSSPLVIPADIDLDVVASSAEQRGEVSAIRFFPDGASSGGTIQLRQAGSFYEIRINWFTGRVHVDRVG
jgi:general secretion pathway protein H